MIMEGARKNPTTFILHVIGSDNTLKAMIRTIGGTNEEIMTIGGINAGIRATWKITTVEGKIHQVPHIIALEAVEEAKTPINTAKGLPTATSTTETMKRIEQSQRKRMKASLQTLIIDVLC